MKERAAMGADFRIDQFSPMGLLARNGAGLVGFHEPRVADHVGGENFVPRDRLPREVLPSQYALKLLYER